jgi:hypothetical protein
MRKKYLILFAAWSITGFSGCNYLDTKIDTQITPETLNSDYSKLQNLGYASYTYIRNGFYLIDNNIPAPMSDEAEQTAPSSGVQLFNQGSWNAYNNPDNPYSYYYQGIQAANFFLDYTVDYKNQLAQNRDTLSDNGHQYDLDVADIGWMRGEAHILRAFFYYDLIKRYGGVPLVTKTLSLTDSLNLPRTDYDTVVDFIVSEIDNYKDSLQVNWKTYDSDKDGRFTQGAALALKSRVLLYAASPLHNESNDLSKWAAAAQAAHDVIALNQYSLSTNYRQLFLGSNSTTDNEIIWSIRCGPTNSMEIENYPIGTPGGNSGVTPSQNLVADYEYPGTPDPGNPYKNRDPRLGFSIVTNNSTWNSRTIEIYSGGTDSWNNTNASKTGYYLKKFLDDNLYLTQNQTVVHNWVMFRYAEILLNYAEAMNEAYGPDLDNGYGMTARAAVNRVRSRTGIGLPPVVAANQSEMRDKIKHERKIELAFEDHRYWDLLRWKDAETVLNQPLRGIKASMNGANSFTYTEFNVENRVFIAPKMYYYPIPDAEIKKSNGVLVQNPGW